MPNPRKAPRLYLRQRKGRDKVWSILDGKTESGTGCGEHDRSGAEKALAQYLAEKHVAPGALPPEQLWVPEVMASYLKEHAVHSPSSKWIGHTAQPILQWWGDKTLADVSGANCREYVTWRTAQTHRHGRKAKPISLQTARHELKTLRTAIDWYHAEHGPLPSVPKVTLPEKKPQRSDCWLTRTEVAARIRAARSSPRLRHVARLILIGVYTGTRPGAILGLHWLPSTTGGWFDLDSETLHRRGSEGRQSRKRQPPARIHDRLLPHLRRWRRLDLENGITAVVHYQGEQVRKLRNSWPTVARLAGVTKRDAPHIVRHTAATWQMQAGTSLYDAAGYLGMSPETLWEVYGHHHPDFQKGAASASNRRPPKVAQGWRKTQ
jgi:integrase